MIRSVSVNVCDNTERSMLTHALSKRLINTRAVAERHGGRHPPAPQSLRAAKELVTQAARLRPVPGLVPRKMQDDGRHAANGQVAHQALFRLHGVVWFGR